MSLGIQYLEAGLEVRTADSKSHCFSSMGDKVSGKVESWGDSGGNEDALSWCSLQQHDAQGRERGSFPPSCYIQI